MKSLITAFITTIFIISAQAQNVTIAPDSTGMYLYRIVIETDHLKAVNHKKIIDYIAYSYKSANDVIQLNTEDKVIAKGNFSISLYGYAHSVDHTLIFDIKDNKIRATYTQFKVNIKDKTNNFENEGHWLYFPSKDKIIKKSSEQLSVIIPEMIKSLKQTVKDDW